ncbi:MAG TPA: hypothetical protein VN721_17445 [Flavipsychrobacter sp.]|nr:hypothetical protein [Flavipsychrobacter sp.]
MVNKENYEEYLLLYVDGELNAEERQELEAFVKLHPELQDEVELYSLTRLTPDTAHIFPDKELLLKKEPVKRAINPKYLWSYGIAAGVAAILFITFWNKQKPQENVVITTAKHETFVPAIKQPEQTQKQVTIAVKNGKKHLFKTHVKQPAIPLPIAKTTVNKNDSVATVSTYQSPMVPVAIVPVKEITVTDTQRIERINTAQPELVSNNKVATKKSLLETLPIDEDKKKEIENLQHVVTNTLQEISVAHEDIRDKGVAFKIGNKELFVVRL